MLGAFLGGFSIESVWLLCLYLSSATCLLLPVSALRSTTKPSVHYPACRNYIINKAANKPHACVPCLSPLDQAALPNLFSVTPHDLLYKAVSGPPVVTPAVFIITSTVCSCSGTLHWPFSPLFVQFRNVEPRICPLGHCSGFGFDWQVFNFSCKFCKVYEYEIEDKGRKKKLFCLLTPGQLF